MRKSAQGNAPDLHCHSTFSILDGLGSPESVVERAVDLGWKAAALTEHGWMGSVPRFYKACRQASIKPILGCEMYVVPHAAFGIRDKEVRSASHHLTVLALSREGYENLVAWNTTSMSPDNFYYRPRISIEAMVEGAKWPLHHNVVLSGCLGSELCQTLVDSNGNGLVAGEAYLKAMEAVFPNFYIELQNHRLTKMMGRGLIEYEAMVERESAVREKLIQLADATGLPVILTNDSHYQLADQRKAHMAMIASKLNAWSKSDIHYAKEYGYFANFMRPLEKIATHTERGGEAIRSIHEIVAEADIALEPLDNFSYSVPFSGSDNPLDEIKRRCKPRLKQLRVKHGDAATDRFEHELKAMGDFAHYLVIMSDLIAFARRNGILTNTRGSAANSIVCYCLRIHDYDSIHYKLTFERFVNPERKKLPDIDIDIEQDRYEDFMTFVHEYMEEREGEGQVVQMCNYGTLANRSTFRMIAESLGIDKEQQDEISKLLPQMIDSGLVDEEEDAYSALKEAHPEIHELASGVFDSMKNVSQHACGWLFGTRDRPIEDWVPMYLIASSGKLVTQYDLKSLEDMGLVKGDFLRLRTLSVIKRCLTLIGKNALDLQAIPLDDKKTFKMLREGRTEGVFTLQGKTNRTGCMEVEVSDVHDVIASVAIYRPALTRPGYHKVYNARRKGEEEVTLPHEVAESVLSESYGLPIFQEQILDLGYAIGFDHIEAQELLDAIKLAKGMGRYAKEAFAKIHPKFVKRARKFGLTEEEAEATWDLVGGFEGYGFNRGHATSYGTLAVRAAYLKCHYPQAFFTALLDVYPEKGRYIAAAKSEGFVILPPDINLSGGGFTRGEDDKSIRVGLARIKHLGPGAVQAILDGQPYSSVDDLKERTDSRAVTKKTIEVLHDVGAFDSLSIFAEPNDIRQLELLGFVLHRPVAFAGLPRTPAHTQAYSTERWRHTGLQRGVELTEGGQSVSKLFWIPDLPADDKELLQLKASPWARVKEWHLLAVDENGIAFHIRAPEEKETESLYLDFMARKHRGNVICMDGAVKQPFDMNGPLAFRMYDVTGAKKEDPQVWGDASEKMINAFSVLSRKKQRDRRKG